MKNYLFLLFLTLLSCDIPDRNDPEYQKFLKLDDHPVSKLSQLELRYIDSLEKASGFKVELRRVEESVDYSVYLTNETLYVDSSNYKELVSLRERVVSELCCKIIPDSIKPELTMISYWYKLPEYKNGKYYQSGLSKQQFSPIATYSFESLLKKCDKK